jgi:hypothetical protein
MGSSHKYLFNNFFNAHFFGIFFVIISILPFRCFPFRAIQIESGGILAMICGKFPLEQMVHPPATGYRDFWEKIIFLIHLLPDYLTSDQASPDHLGI